MSRSPKPCIYIVSYPTPTLHQLHYLSPLCTYQLSFSAIISNPPLVLPLHHIWIPPTYRSISQSVYVCIRVWGFGFETSRFWNFFHFLDGFGFGIERIWYRKKYQIRYCKDLVSEKVSDSVSEKFRIWFCLDFGFFGWCFGFKTSWF